MKKLDLKPNTPEWLEARKNYRTASEAAIVLGLNPWTSIEKFQQLRAGLVKQFYNAAMRRGHELEDQVRQWTSRHLDLAFVEEVWVNGSYLASLDGICGAVLVEIKVSDRTYDEVKAGTVPEYYGVQVQQQLYCSPATTGYLVAYSPKRDDYTISAPIYEDPAVMQRIESAWEVFDALPPPTGPLDLSDDGSVMELFNEYARLKAEGDRISARLAEIKDSLVEAAQGQSAVAGDFKITTKAGAVRYDYKKAATDAGVDLEGYKKSSAPTYTIKLPDNPFL